MVTDSSWRGLLAIVPPYTIAGPPAGSAYLLGALQENGVHDVGFVDLRLRLPAWPHLTFSSIGRSKEAFVMDVPDMPLVLYLLQNFPDTDVWADLERKPWFKRFCDARNLPARTIARTLSHTQRSLQAWASEVQAVTFIGFTTWISNYLASLIACAELKRLPKPPFIILGGPQCSESEAAADLALASGLADAVVVGEGEQSLLELQARIDPVSRTLNGPPPPGVKVWTGRAVIYGGLRKQLPLDALPLPRFDSMDLDAYSLQRREIITETSRGCTDKCEFCSEAVVWRHFRSATPVSLVDRLARLQATTGFRHVMFADSLLNGHAERLTGFSENLLRADLRFSWSGYMRAAMDAPTARLLARAGLNHVFIGIESMSDATLNGMNKRRMSADNVGALESFLDAGISVAAGVVAGFPGDSEGDFARTVGMLESFLQRYPRQFMASVEAFVMTPAAPMFSRSAEFGLRLQPWEDEYLDLAPDYTPIARLSMARVEGMDQGLPRAKKFALATRTLTDSPVSLGARRKSPRSDGRKVVARAMGDWVFAAAPGESRYAFWILTAEEYTSLLRKGLDVNRIEQCAGKTQIRLREAIASGAGARGVVFELVDVVGLHPSVVGRVCHDSETLLLFNGATELLYRVPGSAAPLAEFVADRGRSMGEIIAHAGEWRMSAEQIRDTISDWWSRRLLMGFSSQGNRSERSARLRVLS